MSRFLKVQGLMTMGTLRTNDFETEARRCFKELQELCERLETQLGQKLQTSMGMSQDYEIALEEKSNWIRLGTMMFSSSNVK
jgi:PLP dependent protein